MGDIHAADLWIKRILAFHFACLPAWNRDCTLTVHLMSWQYGHAKTGLWQPFRTHLTVGQTARLVGHIGCKGVCLRPIIITAAAVPVAGSWRGASGNAGRRHVPPSPAVRAERATHRQARACSRWLWLCMLACVGALYVQLEWRGTGWRASSAWWSKYLWKWANVAVLIYMNPNMGIDHYDTQPLRHPAEAKPLGRTYSR